MVRGCLVAAGLMVAGLVSPSAADAHGYVNGPYSRAQACALELNTDCGDVIYEPQSLEAPKGFPASGPADGQIASAGGLFGGNLDAQTSTRWYENNVATGPQTFTWTNTAPHATSQWRYYMTTQGWDPNAPLSRAALELIATVDHDGTAPGPSTAHTVRIPTDRTGYHVVLAVWDIADTTNAFYNAIDVNVTGPGGPATESRPVDTPDNSAPTPPGNLYAMNSSADRVALRWGPATDNVAVAGYRVYRNGTEIARPTSLHHTVVRRGSATTDTYTVRTIDTEGNLSAQSNAITA